VNRRQASLTSHTLNHRRCGDLLVYIVLINIAAIYIILYRHVVCSQHLQKGVVAARRAVLGTSRQLALLATEARGQARGIGLGFVQKRQL
jgi:hypothetical protein